MPGSAGLKAAKVPEGEGLTEVRDHRCQGSAGVRFQRNTVKRSSRRIQCWFSGGNSWRISNTER